MQFVFLCSKVTQVAVFFVVTAVNMRPFAYLSDIMKWLSSSSYDVKDCVYNVKVKASSSVVTV